MMLQFDGFHRLCFPSLAFTRIIVFVKSLARALFPKSPVSEASPRGESRHTHPGPQKLPLELQHVLAPQLRASGLLTKFVRH